MTKKEILNNYEALSAQLVAPMDALEAVRDWLGGIQGNEVGFTNFLETRRQYTAVIDLIMNELERLSDEHDGFIKEASAND